MEPDLDAEWQAEADSFRGHMERLSVQACLLRRAIMARAVRLMLFVGAALTALAFIGLLLMAQ